jgi:hypothetical protein
MSFQTKVIGSATALILSTALAVSVPAQASDAGAFVGGMLTSRVLGNMHQRTEAEQQQAYYAQQNSQQQQVQQAAPAAPAAQTPTDRMNELDKLAAGGYITPAEYKKKKQAIVDSM